FDGLSPDTTQTSERLQALYALGQSKPVVVVTTAEAAIQHTLSRSSLQQAVLSLRVGQLIDRDDLLLRLVQSGYQRSNLVEEIGQFAVRGAVVDLYSPNY